MVAPAIIGAGIGAVGSLLGGLFGNKAKEDAAEKNAKLQKEFAQSGIQWKVKDAEKAGVHPLAALGAQTVSFTPSYIGGDDPGIAAAGQNIAGAIERTQTAPQRLGALAQKAQELSVEKIGLENDLLRSQIAVQNSQLTPPIPSAVDPFHTPGQTQSGVQTVPLQRIASSWAPWAEAGPVSDVGFTNTRHNGLAPVMSKDAKERLEEDMWGTLGWNIRNRLVPMMTPYEKKGYMFNPVTMEYHPLPWSSHHGR